MYMHMYCVRALTTVKRAIFAPRERTTQAEDAPRNRQRPRVLQAAVTHVASYNSHQVPRCIFDLARGGQPARVAVRPSRAPADALCLPRAARPYLIQRERERYYVVHTAECHLSTPEYRWSWSPAETAGHGRVHYVSKQAIVSGRSRWFRAQHARCAPRCLPNGP